MSIVTVVCIVVGMVALWFIHVEWPLIKAKISSWLKRG